MPKYVMLSTLTPKGTQTLQANPDRLQEVNRDVKELGATVLHQWAMIGAYDFLNIIEAPDAKTMARISVAPSSSTSRLTSFRRSGFAWSVCVPFGVRVESITYFGIHASFGRGTERSFSLADWSR